MTVTDIRTKQERGRYEIRNATEKEAELWIYDEISRFWGLDAGEFNRDLAKITAQTINLRINSPGGEVHAGIAIYNALRRHPARVVTYVDGIAASIASIVALAGDEVIMPKNTFMMIHNPHAIAIGDSQSMREMADILDKHGEVLRDIYASRSGKDADAVQALMDAETWFTADEAKEAGFADTVTEEMEIAASVDLTAFEFKNIPAPLAPAPAGLTAEQRRQLVAEWAEFQRGA